MAITPEQREIRELRKALKQMVTATGLFLNALDAEYGLGGRTPSPDQGRGGRVAKLANLLDYERDKVRYFALGLDHRKDPESQKRTKTPWRVRK